MAATTPCPRCGKSAYADERSALAGNCPACLAQDLLGPAEWELAKPATDTNFLGPYRLRRKLGEGGMGAVYLAQDSRSRRTVAVKVLPKRKQGDEDNVKRFRREARAAIRLSHPNLARGFETGEDRGHPYFVMEYCDGETLERRLERERRLPWREAVRIAIPIARALGHAHENGLVHRDVKPSNIVVTKEGVPKLLDLGISKELGESSFRTQTGVVLGTPQYLSPEQARGDRAIDGRSDLFSLGATLYHLVTGQVPITASDLIEVVAQHLTVEIPDPRTHAPDLPEPFALLLRKMLSKEPGDRPRDAAELVRDLTGVLQGKAPSRRRPYLLAGAAAAAVVLIATILLWPSAEPPPAPPPPPAAKKPVAGPRPLPPPPAPKPVVTRGPEATRGPVAHYPLDDAGPTAIDRIGGNHGQWIGEVTASNEDDVRSVRLNGSRGPAYIELPRCETLDRLTEGTYSISAWVKPRSVPPGNGPDSEFAIVGKQGYRSGLAYINSGRFLMYHWTSGSPPALTGAVGLPETASELGRWYHLVGVVDQEAKEIRCFMDGALVCDPIKLPGEGRPYNYRNVPWRIGIGDPKPESPWRSQMNGNVRHVRFYDRALLPEDVRSLSASEERPPTPPRVQVQVPVPSEGLVGYWTFDEALGPAAKDSSGRGNHGNHVNEPTPDSDVPGTPLSNPRALRFDATREQKVVVPHHDSLNLTRSFTLAAWVKPTARTGYQQGIIEKYNWVSVEAQGGYTFRLAKNGHVSFIINPASGGGKGPWAQNHTVPPGVWSHVAGVYDATKRAARIYLNGILLNEEVNIPPSSESDQPLHLGADYGGNRFHGLLDEVRIYGRALAPEEIKSLAGQPVVERKPDPPSPLRTEIRGEPVDLLPLVDLSQDVVKGAWTRSGKDLVTPLATTENRVRVRHQPEKEYDLVAVVRREDGPNCIAFLLPTPEGQVMVALDGWDQGDRTALCRASGREDEGNNSTTHTGKLLAAGKPATIRLAVRRDGIRLWVEDRPIFDWKGDPSQLSINEAWRVPRRDLIHVGNSWSKIRILSLTMIPIRTP